jgi:PPOX class probable F420-dependent enzyme
MSTTSSTLTGAAREFLTDALRFGVISTLDPDGSPHQVPVWYALADEGILVNSREGRRWPGNLRRDPRASVAVVDGYRYVIVRGAVEIDDDPDGAQADIAGLARRYHADDPAAAERKIAVFRTQRRVSFLLRPRSVIAELEA